MTIPASLQARLRERTIIPFVGAGVSMAVKHCDGRNLFPSWKQLLEKGAQRLEDESKPQDATLVRALLGVEDPDYLYAARRLRDNLGPLWTTFLKEVFDVPRTEIDEESLALGQAIWGLGSDLIVTTNYDRALEWACPPELVNELETWDVESPAEQAEMLRLGVSANPTIWNLHGRIRNAANLILTPDGYERLYPTRREAGSQEQAKPRFGAAIATLRHLLAARSFLFIGFSMADEHFGVELGGVLDNFEGNNGPHYVLAQRERAESLRKEVPSGVEVVEFEGFGQPLVDLVETLGDRGQTPGFSPETEFAAGRVVGPIGEAEDSNGAACDVFLATVSDSLQQTRRRLQDELTRNGVKVSERVPPPHSTQPHRQVALEVIRNARLTVHLIDEFAGAEIYDEEGKTYPREQLMLGLEHARSQVIWVPRKLEVSEIEDADQGTLIADLKARRLGEEYDFHRSRRADLAGDILEKLQHLPHTSQPRQAQTVLLDTHTSDQDLVRETSRWLLDRGVLPLINPLEDDPRTNLQFLKERLSKVTALVVFQGRVSDEWVCSRLDEAIKIVHTERCPVKSFGVYLAPPAGKRIEPYNRFRFLNFHLIDNQKGFDAEALEPLHYSLSSEGIE